MRVNQPIERVKFSEDDFEYLFENLSKKEMDMIDLKDKLYELSLQVSVTSIALRDKSKVVSLDSQVKELERELRETLLILECWETDEEVAKAEETAEVE